MKTRIGTDVEEAVYWLEKGQVVAIPTETVYGLAGNALNVRAVTRIFSVKERPFFDPLIVHLPEAGAVRAYVTVLPPTAWRLMTVFWPGPLTVVLPRKPVVPDIVTAGLPAAAFRVPRHPVTQALLQRLPFPLAAPSANRFGRISPTRPEHVLEQLGGRIPYILEGGPAEVGVESTIVKVAADDATIWLLRPGGIPAEAIEKIAGKTLADARKDKVEAPGQLPRHYSPKVPLAVVDSLASWVSVHGMRSSVGFLAFRKLPSGVKWGEVLSPAGNLEEAAARLFALLHRLEKNPAVRRIVAEKVPDRGLGRAINDRLRRAAGSDGPAQTG